MSTCGSCFGEGKVSCSGCGGRGYATRLTGNGEMETTPCVVCGGKRRMRCDFCAGTGNLLRNGILEPRTTCPRTPGNDVLAGTWKGMQGGSYEFIKKGDHYELKEYGLLGRSGSGIATISGNTVLLEVTNVLLGRYSFLLQLEKDTLRGSMKILGIPVPMVLTRGEEREQ